MSDIEDILLEQMTVKQLKKLRNTLKSVYFYSIATSLDDYPQATMIQAILTKDWHIKFISDSHTKKVRNLLVNPNTWLIADATGFFHIPKVVYIKGLANIEPLNKELFNNFLSYHGPISKRILQSIAKGKVDEASLVTIVPNKFITVGLFGGMDEQVSFDTKKYLVAV